MLPLVLIIAAFICATIAALSVPTGRVSIGWAGIALWFLSLFVERL